jgi:hypothetical protein
LNRTTLVLSCLALVGLALIALSISLSILETTVEQGSHNGVKIDSFYYTGTEQLLNVTFQLTNTGPVAENLTIKVILDNAVVNTQNVTDFPPNVTRWFTMPRLVSFDPWSNHSGRLVADSAEFGFWTTCITNSYGHFCTVHYLWRGEEISCGLRPSGGPVSCIKTNPPFSFFQNISPIVYVGIAGSILVVASLIAAPVYRKEEAPASKMWTSQVGSGDLRNV